jgi:hypothetical protein
MTHPRSQSFLNDYIKSSISSLGTKDWTAGDKATYSVKIRQARERLSVALQMSMERLLLVCESVAPRDIRASTPPGSARTAMSRTF